MFASVSELEGASLSSPSYSAHSIQDLADRLLSQIRSTYNTEARDAIRTLSGLLNPMQKWLV